MSAGAADSIDDLDLLIEAAAVQGQLYDGVSSSVIAASSSLGARGVAVLAGKKGVKKKRRNPPWSTKDDDYLREHLGILSEEEIAEVLGRTVSGVHNRWKRDLRLTAPSKNPDLITAEQVANGLGVDSKTVHALIDRGILPGYRLPLSCTLRVVRRVQLLQFICNPMNWAYIKPERIGSSPFRRSKKSYDREFWSYARRLVRKRMSLWKDEWLLIGDVARMVDIDVRLVNNAVRHGRLKAVDWGNWRILKSEALANGNKIRSCVGSGGKGQDRLGVTSSIEEFIVLACAIGLTKMTIGHLMKWSPKRVAYVYNRMHKRIPQIIEKGKLAVIYDRKRKQVYADWTMHRGRFPKLATIMQGGVGKNLSKSEFETIGLIRYKADVYRTSVECSNSKYLSDRQIAVGLKSPIESVRLLMDRGILRRVVLESDPHAYFAKKSMVLRFLANPLNWVYFRTKYVGLKPGSVNACLYDRAFWNEAKRLIKQRQKTWHDEYWRMGRAAKYLGLNRTSLYRVIRAGEIPAVDWGNYWLLRSDVMKYEPVVKHRKTMGDCSFDKLGLGIKDLCFAIISEAIGQTREETARTMKCDPKTVYYVMSKLKKSGKVGMLIKSNKLNVSYDAKTGKLSADWHKYRKMFPDFARKVTGLMKAGASDRFEKKLLNSTIAKSCRAKNAETAVRRISVKRCA